MHCRSARRPIPYRLSPSDRSAARAGIGRKDASSLFGPGFDDDSSGLSGIISHTEQQEISSVDLAFTGHGAAQPFAKAAPVLLSKKNDRKMFDLAGLYQGQRFEQLVQCAVPAGKHDKCGSILDEHRLPNEEELEVQAACEK